jgi:serine/threonine-protein kinase
MAKLGNILFSRALNKFLECEDLGSTKGLSLIEKIEEVANDNLDKVLTTITQVDEPHKEALKNICRESIGGFSEEYFLGALVHDETVFRTAASDILSHTTAIDANKLFRRLHEPGASRSEVIDVLAAQQQSLKPEDIINHALKLEPDYAIQLLKLAEGSEQPVDLSKVSFQLGKIESPEFKINLLHYFGSVDQPMIPSIVASFLNDSNKVVVLEALKTLDRTKIDFDASVLLPYTATMSGVDLELLLKIIARQANADLVPHLSAYLAANSTELNHFFARIIVVNTNLVTFEKLLQHLMIEDEWTQRQAIACIQKHANDGLSEVARELIGHEQEFVRNTAQALVINLLGESDLGKIEEFALNENWQVRERAIQSLAKSSNRGAVAILRKQVEAFPDDYVLVLRAVKRLGFAEGLEIAFGGLKSSQANVQRFALEAIEAITTEEHAGNVRDTIMPNLPSLTPEMREFAKMLMSQITQDYGLPAIQPDEKMNTIDGEVDFQVTGDGNPTPAPPANVSLLDKLTPGSVWMDRYLIKKEIGRGAMGRVMLVEDDMVDESLVLKLMLPELTINQQSAERFKREVKYSRKVSHPNVIRVHDILLKDRVCAISMEYFESRGLDVVLKEIDFFDRHEGLRILYQIANGMVAAHDQGVIHRDLKPSNLLINDKGHLKIVDFGIASAGAHAESTLTQTGSIIGSPAYLSPERIAGLDADERSDIYSLGIIAYFMFSGKLPYTGKPMEVIIRHRDGDAPLLTEVNKDAAEDVSGLIVKMMAVEPADRLQSMAVVGNEVKTLLESS